jgi:hypothetical protein
MTTIPREELQAIFERLAFPSALQLRAVIAQEKVRAARTPQPPDYRPWRLSIKDAKEFAKKAGQRQILARTQPFDGKIASGRLDQRWAADIISYAAQPAKVGSMTFQYILIVQDIFSREIWTRALASVKADTVALAFRQILIASGRTPKELNTDGGTEFTGAFVALRKEYKIEHRVTERQNDIATLDVAILKLHRALTRITSTPGKGNWAQVLKAATDAYNETPHGAIYDEAPEKVSGNSEESKSLRFDLQQQNAEKFAQQSQVFQKKVEKLDEANAFRVQIKQRQGMGLARRGYKPTHEKERIALTGIDHNSGNVRGIDPDGKAVKRSIREVMPVPDNSTTVHDPPGQGAVRDARVEDKRCTATRGLRDKVFEYLNMPRTTTQVSTHIGAEGRKLIKDNRLQTVKRFMEL